MQVLDNAAHQWANRPADERFWSVQDLREALQSEKDATIIGSVPSSALRVEADAGELLLRGINTHAKLTNWSFGQLCQRAGAPGAYLQKLPATLTAQNINHGLKNTDDNQQTKLLLHQENGAYRARALTSARYSRIPDLRICDHLEALQRDGWRTPPARPAVEDPRARPATQDDVLNARSTLSISVGDMIAPAGVYRGDRDLFIFMVNEQARINDGTNEGLSRGFFVWNSEVGARSFGLMTFFYRWVCGNHFVWHPKGVKEIRLRHIGQADWRARRELIATVRQYADTSAAHDEARIKEAQNFRVGQDMDEAIDLLFAKRLTTRLAARAAIESTRKHPEDGDPLTCWGVAQGLTRLSQNNDYAGDRVELDRAAGKVLELAF